MPNSASHIVGTLTLALVLCSASAAAAAQPVPGFADISYGPHPHQLLDIYVPLGDGPFPVLIWYGGLWKPAKGPADPGRFNKEGIAVVAVEVRTLADAQTEHFNPPIAYVMDDACRAVQFVRHNGATWHLDGRRIVVGGGSQGALPALYVGCSADHANPRSADPVERESTKVLAVAAHRSQPTIDPVRQQQWVPGVKWGVPALGCSYEESQKRRDELLPIIQKYSPDYLLHRGAAPIYFENNWGATQPSDVKEMDYKVHSPAWGIGFQKLAQEAGVECYLKYPGHPTEQYADIWSFIIHRSKDR